MTEELSFEWVPAGAGIRTIRGVVSDRPAFLAARQRWTDDLAPGATGWLGSTTGIGDDNQFFSLLRYTSEESARRDGERHEQIEWWSEIRRSLDGEPTVTEGTTLYVETPGRTEDAGFVQVITAQTADGERSLQKARQTAELRAAMRPEILTTVVVGHVGGRYTMLVYFVSEAAARLGQQRPVPSEAIEAMRSMSDLVVGPPQYLELSELWIDTPSS